MRAGRDVQCKGRGISNASSGGCDSQRHGSRCGVRCGRQLQRDEMNSGSRNIRGGKAEAVIPPAGPRPTAQREN